MADLKVQLSLDSSKFVGGLKDAKSSVDSFASESDAAQAAIEKIDKKMQRQIDTANRYSRQVASMREAIVGYQKTYNDLSDDLQNSDFGKNILKRIEELTNSAGELQDVITETSNAIRMQADGEIMYQATLDGLDILASSMQTVIGVQGQLGASTEKLMKAITAMQTVQAAANVVTKTTEALQRDSAIAQAVARAATSKNIVVMKAATLAQKAMNVAVKANPYVIAAMALTALTVAVYKFVTAETEAEKAQREFNESLKENYISTYTDTLGSAKAQFALLQAEWKNLKTEAEKTAWLDKNKSKLESLIGTVDDITTAENIFINNTANVEKAFKARARAAASSQILEEAYKNEIEEITKYEKMSDAEKLKYAKGLGIDLSNPKYSRQVKNPNYSGRFTNMYQSQYGGSSEKRSTTEYMWNNIDKRVEAEISKRHKKTIDLATKEAADASKQIKTIYDSIGVDKPTKTTPTKTTTPKKETIPTPTIDTKETLRNLEAKKKEIVEKMQNAGQEDYLSLKVQLDDIDKKIEDFKAGVKSDNFDMLLNAPIARIDTKTTLRKLEAQRKEIVDKMQDASQEDYISLKLRLEATDKEIEDFKSGSLLDNIKLDPINVDDALKEMREKAEAEFDKMMEKAEEYKNQVSDFGSIFSSVGDAMERLGGEGSGAWMKFTGTAIQGMATMIPLITKLIGAKSAEAMISGTAEGAKLPFPASLAAIATIVATISSIISSLPKFSSGGVFKGTSSIGDMNIARVNDGEMLLNNRQQANLFRLLNGEYSRANEFPTEISWRLRGSDIYGSMKNYSAMKNKAGKNINF